MPGTVTVHNSVAADITVKLSGSSTGGTTSGKCHAGGNVTLDLTKMTGSGGNRHRRCRIDAAHAQERKI